LQGSRILDTPEIKAMYAGYPANFAETLIELASLRILGRERPTRGSGGRESPRRRESYQPPEIAEDVRQAKQFGTVG